MGADSLTQASEAREAAVRHWRALVELQISAAGEAYRLASSHAERRNEVLTQMMDGLWAAPAWTKRKAEADHG